MTWKNGIVIVFLAMGSVGGKQIDHADAIFVSLWQIKFIIGVIVWMTFVERAMTYGFFARIHLMTFLGGL